MYLLQYSITIPPRFGGKRRLPRPHSCTPLLLVTIKGGGRLPLDGTHKKDASGRDPSSLTLRHPYSSRSTPLLAENWEPSSLSCLACIPYYKHSGCKIIQCPRTPSLLDVRPRGRNQDKPSVTVIASCIIIWDEETRSIYWLGSRPPGRDTDTFILLSYNHK